MVMQYTQRHFRLIQPAVGGFRSASNAPREGQ
jgi:hypothetical protein